MPIVKAAKHKSGTYFTADRTAIEDAKLSWSAKGMWSYLMSKPAKWRIIIADLINSSSDGRDKVYSILAELIEAGYVIRERELNPTTKQYTATVYTVYELPLTVIPYTATQYGNPVSGAPLYGDPLYGNPATSKNKYSKNDSIKNHSSKNDLIKNKDRTRPAPEAEKEQTEPEHVPEYAQKDIALFRSRLKHMPKPVDVAVSISIVPETLIPADPLGMDLMQRAGVLAFKFVDDYSTWIEALQTEGIDCAEVVNYWSDHKQDYNLVDAVINQLRLKIEERN